MTNKIWMNGHFVDAKDAKVSIADRGFLYGDGVFETMRGYAGIVFRIDEHLSRLYAALKVMKIKLSYEKASLKRAIDACVKKNRLKSAYIRVTVTRGEGNVGLHFSKMTTPNVVIVAKGHVEYPQSFYTEGISVGVAQIRQNELSPLSGIKSLNFLNYILARIDAKDKGYDDAILLNTKGYIAEGATSNIFLVKKGALITPSIESGILPGIARKVVIGIAKRLKIPIKEKLIAYRELVAADEVFFTNSLIEILPVVRVDAKHIGLGVPGDLTKLLHISYQKTVICESLSR